MEQPHFQQYRNMTFYLGRLEEVKAKIRDIKAEVKAQPAVMCKWEVMRQAEHWGWQIIQRGGKHPIKAVRNKLTVAIPGHGKGDYLGQGMVHKLLKELSEPILSDLKHQEQQYTEQFINLALSFNGYHGLSFSEVRQLQEDLDFYHDLSHEQEKEMENLKMLNEQLAQKRQMAEEAALELLSNLELKNQKQKLENQELASKVTALAKDQMRSQQVIEQVIVALKHIHALSRKIEAVVNLTPLPWAIPIRKYIDQITAIFDSDLLSASPLNLPPESDHGSY